MTQQGGETVRIRAWLRWVAGISLGLMLALLGANLALLPGVAAFTAPSTEIRGVWLTNIDSEVLFQPEQLTAALKRLKRLQFNTVYPTVWNGGYTLYPSPVAEQAIGRAIDPDPRFQGRDPLAEVVETSHTQGLSVIPWLEFGLMAPAESELAQRHPDWIAQRRDRTTVFMEGSHPRVWLNPLHPQVQQFMVDAIADIARRYPVDGIQLDDHFGLPVEFGYDPLTLKLYQAEHGGRLPPDNATDPAWMRWRADKLTALMKRIFYAVKAENPDCLISLSPNPRKFSYDKYLQDWWTWERQGFIEELIVQIYRNDLFSFVAELNRPEMDLAKQHIPVGIGILTGLKHRSVPMGQIAKQVEVSRQQGFAGVSFFFYETLDTSETETPLEREKRFSQLFPHSATRPTLSTQDSQ